MKIKIKKNILEKNIQILSKAIVQHPALYCLSGIMIEAKESFIELISSNGNFSIKIIIEINDDVQILEPGKILVNGYLIRNIIKKQEKDVEIYDENNLIYFKSEKSEVKINSLNIDDYPKISFDNIGTGIKFNLNDFQKAIKNISFAAAENDKRIILNGVNLKTIGNKLFFSATNSYRFAIDSIPIESEKEINLTIFSKDIKEFLPTQISNNNIEIKVDESKINFINSNVNIQSKVIDAEYPDLFKLIPSEYESVLKIDPKILIDMIEKITVIHTSYAPIKMSIINNLLTLETKKEEIGNSKTETIDFNFSGEDLEITFDSNFMKDALKSFEDNEVNINFNGKLKPIVFKRRIKRRFSSFNLTSQSFLNNYKLFIFNKINILK